MLVSYKFLIFLMFNFSNSFSEGLKIVGIFPHYTKSHNSVFSPILKELASRGHSVTLYTLFTQTTPISNLKDISLHDPDAEPHTESLDFDGMMYMHNKPFNCFFMLSQWSAKSCKDLLKNERIQELIHSKEKYDLIIFEDYIDECLFALAAKLNVPYIGISSSVIMPFGYNRYGFINNPSIIPNLFSLHGTNMTFSERVINSLYSWSFEVFWEMFTIPKMQESVDKYIPEPTPQITEATKESSLVLVNSHFSLHGSRPLGPNYIEIAGVHMEKIKKLPEDLQNWMDDSTNGVILFCMGSNLNGASLPKDKKKAFVRVFRELKEKVLWKWEEMYFPEKPNNVRIEKWIPQRDILAHPKTKLFISHCGCLSTIEAVDSGVPMLCIPMFGDQPSNQREAEQKGFSVFLEYNDINEDTLREKIKTALKSEYKKNAMEVQRTFQDRPMSPLDTAIYWIEYTARHKGANYLKMASRHLRWYQKALLDVFAVYLLLVLIVLFVIRKLISKLSMSKSTTTTTTKKS